MARRDRGFAGGALAWQAWRIGFGVDAFLFGVAILTGRLSFTGRSWVLAVQTLLITRGPELLNARHTR